MFTDNIPHLICVKLTNVQTPAAITPVLKFFVQQHLFSIGIVNILGKQYSWLLHVTYLC